MVGLIFLIVLVTIFDYGHGRRITPNQSSSYDESPHHQFTDNMHQEEETQQQQIRRQLYTMPSLKPEDHLVTSLPGFNVKDADFNQYAGHILADSSKGGHLFYWLFESKKESISERPLIIWLNGGPGCSSMDGLWLELGPLRLNDDQTVRVNPYSWHKIGNILFIDQPVGTGFAYTLNKDGYAKNDETINSHFYNFLMGFLEIHTQYVRREGLSGGGTGSGNAGTSGTGANSGSGSGGANSESSSGSGGTTSSSAGGGMGTGMGSASSSGGSAASSNNNNNNNRRGGGSSGSGIPLTTVPIYFTGESHAGHYIPSIVNYILQKNSEAGATVRLNVQGIALGNPWLDPVNQYNPAEFAHGLGILSSGQVNKLAEQDGKCRQLLKQGRLNSNVCYSLLDNVIDASTLTGAAKVLMYDTRKYVQSSRSFPPGHEALERYLNRVDVQQALHVKNFKANPNANNNIKYVECADPPYNALSHQDGKGVVNELINILNSPIRVMVFAGQFDLICNHVNLEKALDAMKWSGQEEWRMKTPGVWVVNKKPAGYSRSYNNLQFLVVLDSGHMVPMDQPEIAFAMIKSFVENKPLSNGDSKLGVTASVSPSLSGEGGASAVSTAENSLDGGVICPISSTSTTRALSAVVDSAATSAPAFTGSSHNARHSGQVSGQHHPSHYHPVIVHGTLASEDSVFLRLKIQHSSGSVSPVSSAPSTAHHAVSGDANHQYFIAIQPGRKRLDISFQWFHTSNSHIDVFIDKLTPGTEYHFRVDKQVSPTTTSTSSSGTIDSSAPQASHSTSHHLPHSARRVISLKTGCFHDEFLPCCSHGECVPFTSTSDSSSTSKLYGNNTRSMCQCDSGYVGSNCDHYHIADQKSGQQVIVHGHDSEKDVVLCPSKVISMQANPATAKHFNFMELPVVATIVDSDAMRPTRRGAGDGYGFHPSSDLLSSALSGFPSVSSSSSSITDTLISFTEGCQGSCCVHIELALEMTKLREILLDNDSTASSVSLANDAASRHRIESSLTNEMHSLWQASTVSSVTNKKFAFKLSVSLRPKDTMALPLFLSMCGDVDRMNSAVFQLSKYITTKAVEKLESESTSSSLSFSNALSPTTFRILSNPMDVAVMKASLASSVMTDKDQSLVPPSHLIDHLVDTDLGNSYYSMSSYLKFALAMVIICFILSFFQLLPSNTFWTRSVGGSGKESSSSTVGIGMLSRGSRKSSKA